jgi:cytochrome b6-f complex iron-sulfur subunit
MGHLHLVNTFLKMINYIWVYFYPAPSDYADPQLKFARKKGDTPTMGYQPDNNLPHQDVDIGRRRVITYLLGFSVVATLGGVFTPIIGYLWPPARASAGGNSRVDVGTVNDFPVGQGKVVAVNDRPVIIVNLEQNGLKAYSAICPHLGCIVEWDQGRNFILCPCHDGRFNGLNGAVISGPPPSGLPELDLAVENDTVFINIA